MKPAAQTTPAPEQRQCTSCGKTLSLNFFGLDAKECRRCEAKINRSDIQERPLELTT